MRKATFLLAAMWLFGCVAAARAGEIEGVQPAALDQPRIYMAVWRDATKEPLSAGKKPAVTLPGMKDKDLDLDDSPGFVIEAFLDTGASDIMLAASTAKALGVKPLLVDQKPAHVFDVGVSGEEAFGISEPLFVGTSDFSSTKQGNNAAGYARAKTAQPLKLRESGGLLDELTGGLDIAGMPAMAGQVVVIDVRGLDKLDLLKTTIVPPKDPSIPKTDSTIKLSYVDFTRFTRVDPASVTRPLTSPNPMIGPSPLGPIAASPPAPGGDAPKPVVITFGQQHANLTMLLDTGAVSSMISTKVAAQLGVTIGKDGWLVGVPRNKQFQLPIGGIGGESNTTGFFADSLVLPVSHGQPISYKGAPVLVKDITVTDPTTQETFTLDGVFGMNYLVASVEITGGLLPDLGKTSGSPFEQIVIDHAAGELRVK